MLQTIKLLIRDGFLHILTGNTLSKMISFVSSIVIVRLVSKADYGYLAYVDNWYSYITLFAGLGLSTAILKYVTPDRPSGENKFFLFTALKYGTAFQLILTSILVVYIFNSKHLAFPQAKELIYIMFLFPVCNHFVNTTQNYIRAFLNNKLFAVIGVIQTLAVFVFSVIFVILIGIKGVVFARYVAAGIAVFIGIRYIKSTFDSSAIRQIDTEEYKFFWKISLSLMLANLFSMIMPINELFLISGILKNEVLTANYKVAILIPSQIQFITNSVAIYVFPKIAQMKGDLKAVYTFSIKIEKLLLVTCAGVCFIGILLSPQIIDLIFGERYLDAVPLMRLYWIVYCLNAGLRMLPMNILPAIGITSFNMYNSIVSCVIHIILLYFGLLKGGINMAPYALMTVYLIGGSIYWFYIRRYCRSEQK